MANEKSKSNNCMKVDYITITNADFFTEERLSSWRVFIAKCCWNICEEMMKKIDPMDGISYFVSKSLVNEVVGDAVIGMAKIIDKTPHPVERPNAFKIAAYLSYWFLRHKPISILYPPETDLDIIHVADGCLTDSKYLSWQLKHINEMVAVNMATTFIFNFENELCDKKQCDKIKANDIIDGMSTFCFEDFNQQRRVMLQKLTYYFTYRAIAPKVIEHVLEGYAFHPAWGLTGSHWKTDMDGEQS